MFVWVKVCARARTDSSFSGSQFLQQNVVMNDEWNFLCTGYRTDILVLLSRWLCTKQYITQKNTDLIGFFTGRYYVRAKSSSKWLVSAGCIGMCIDLRKRYANDWFVCWTNRCKKHVSLSYLAILDYWHNNIDMLSTVWNSWLQTNENKAPLLTCFWWENKKYIKKNIIW